MPTTCSSSGERAAERAAALSASLEWRPCVGSGGAALLPLAALGGAALGSRSMCVEMQADAVGGEAERKVPLAVHARALEVEHAVEDGGLLLQQAWVVALALWRAARAAGVEIGSRPAAFRALAAACTH